MELTERTIDSELKYHGVIVDLHLDRAELCDGTVVRREVVEHPGGATVLPIDDDGTCYCVRQYRYPIGRTLLEAPAGKLSKGEDHRVCAVRELSEETGFTADEIIYLGPVCSSPGIASEIIHVYLALGLHPGASHPDEGEFLNVEKHHIDELFDMAMSGELDDAKTVIAVLKAKAYLAQKK